MQLDPLVGQNIFTLEEAFLLLLFYIILLVLQQTFSVCICQTCHQQFIKKDHTGSPINVSHKEQAQCKHYFLKVLFSAYYF